jgi:hypothetical protein
MNGNEAMKQEPIYSTIIGTSDRVIPGILRLYVPEGSLIADLTYRTGVFWKQVDTWKYRLVTSDLAPLPGLSVRCDLRRTPYRDESFDCVVLDPPYGNGSTKPRRDHIQEQYDTASCMTPAEIKELYRYGLPEAHRILRPRGIMIVKCQPMVDGGKQHWIDCTVFDWATVLHGMIGLDRFHMIPPAKPPMHSKWVVQQHARKWGSIFWVFKKDSPQRRRGRGGASNERSHFTDRSGNGAGSGRGADEQRSSENSDRTGTLKDHGHSLAE